MSIKIKHFLVAIPSILIAILMIFSLNRVEAHEASLKEATYKATYEVGGTSNMGRNMIKKYFLPELMLERIDDYYFISLTQTSPSITGLTMLVEDKNAGWMVRSSDGEVITTTFTVSKETLNSEMQMSCYITKMGMDQSFTIAINFDSLEEVSSSVEDIPNRPGYFGEKPDFKRVFPMWGYMAIAGGVIAVAGIGLGVYFGYFKKKRKLNN